MIEHETKKVEIEETLEKNNVKTDYLKVLYTTQNSGSDNSDIPNNTTEFVQNPYLPANLQKKAEALLDEDFSSVNFYLNSVNALNLGAKAYAQGNNIHFAPGNYNPYSTGGQELIAHELVHVSQQRKGLVKPEILTSFGWMNNSENFENQANESAKMILRGSKIINNFKSKKNIYPSYVIQMSPEIIGDIEYGSLHNSLRSVQLKVDSNGDQKFDLICTILLKNKSKGIISFKKNDSKDVIGEFNFDLKVELKDVHKEFYVTNQSPLSAASPFILNFLNNNLTIQVNRDEVTIIGKETKQYTLKHYSHDIANATPTIGYQYTSQMGSLGDVNVLLTDRYFFQTKPFNEIVSIHFQQDSHSDGKLVLIPQIGLFYPSLKDGVQKPMKKIEIEGGFLNELIIKCEEIKNINGISYLFTFSNKGSETNETPKILKQIYFLAYYSGTKKGDDIKNNSVTLEYYPLNEKRILKTEISHSLVSDLKNDERNIASFQIKGLPEDENYKLETSITNLRMPDHFKNAASIDAEKVFDKKILFNSINENWSFKHDPIILKNIKKLSSRELLTTNGLDDHDLAAIAFFIAWDNVKQLIIGGELVTKELLDELAARQEEYWREIHAKGLTASGPEGSAGSGSNYSGGGNPKRDKISNLAYSNIVNVSDLDNLLEPKMDILNLYRLEIGLAKKLTKWYDDHDLKENNITNLQDLNSLIWQVRLIEKKSLSFDAIKAKSGSFSTVIGTGEYSDYHTSRAMFYPDRQPDNQNITGYPVDIIVYKELSTKINGAIEITWHVMAMNFENRVHHESISIDGGNDLAKMHENVMTTLSDSDFCPPGILFYQLIPEGAKEKSNFISGSVKLKGEDDNDFLGDIGNYILLGANIVSAFTPFGPIVVGLTSCVSVANSGFTFYNKIQEGSYGLKDVFTLGVDTFAAIFDSIGAVRSVKGLTALDLVLENGKKCKLFSKTPELLLTDGLGGVMVAVEAIEAYRQYSDRKKGQGSDIRDSELLKILTFFITQGAIVGASGYSKYNDIKELNSHQKNYDQLFSSNQNNSDINITILKKEKSASSKKEAENQNQHSNVDNQQTNIEESKIKKLNEQKKQEKINQAIIEFEDKNKGKNWLRNYDEFKRFHVDKNLKLDSEILKKTELQQKNFLLKTYTTYGNEKLVELTKYIKKEKLDISTFVKLHEELKLNSNLNLEDVAFLHMFFKGDETVIKNFLNDDAIKYDDFIIRSFIKHCENPDEILKLIKEDKTKIRFYELILHSISKQIKIDYSIKIVKLTELEKILTEDIKKITAENPNLKRLGVLRTQIHNVEQKRLLIEKTNLAEELANSKKEIKSNDIQMNNNNVSMNGNYNEIQMIEKDINSLNPNISNRIEDLKNIESEISILNEPSLKKQKESISDYLKQQQELKNLIWSLESAKGSIEGKKTKRTQKSRQNIRNLQKNIDLKEKQMKTLMNNNTSIDFNNDKLEDLLEDTNKDIFRLNQSRESLTDLNLTLTELTNKKSTLENKIKELELENFKIQKNNENLIELNNDLNIKLKEKETKMDQLMTKIDTSNEEISLSSSTAENRKTEMDNLTDEIDGIRNSQEYVDLENNIQTNPFDELKLHNFLENDLKVVNQKLKQLADEKGILEQIDIESRKWNKAAESSVKILKQQVLTDEQKNLKTIFDVDQIVDKSKTETEKLAAIIKWMAEHYRSEFKQ